MSLPSPDPSDVSPPSTGSLAGAAPARSLDVPALPGRPLLDVFGVCLPVGLRRYFAVFYYLAAVAGRPPAPPGTVLVTFEHLADVFGRSQAWLYAALRALDHAGYLRVVDVPAVFADCCPPRARLFCLRLPALHVRSAVCARRPELALPLVVRTPLIAAVVVTARRWLASLLRAW